MENLILLVQTLPPLPLFFAMFVLIYLTAYFVVFRRWTPKTRPVAASCVISLFHGSPAAILAARALISHPGLSFSSPNTPSEALVLDFSVAYFLTDILHYLVFFPTDVLFIGHHVATLYIFLSCRYIVRHGSYAILFLLILAEVTSACQNTWTLGRVRRDDVPFAAKLYAYLSPPFYAFYSVVRGIVAPLFVYKMGAFYISGQADSLVPRWAWVSWMTVVVIALLVSISWIYGLWCELYRERTDKMKKKVR
ncbi:TLC domain-containing protein At5g14285 [Punica granatum]|uniref:TLC domain-containing protein n=2 Tax=Punica granatum TaxID=22663 RepID=A0A218WG63_PUNGR|nr:TLC domain-containing protein At5g14285 [Punica granatum]OWM71459.1 hypothetical protein CDL15_Pgr005646 [Punica granatum]PKI79092.1 hypothetical protein CRG98_000384 [Punica granatum]